MIRFFAGHPTAAGLLMLLLLAAGLASLPTLKRETFPDFAPREIEVRALYPGASAKEVEDAICQRIEDVVDSVTNLAEVRCEAREGVGIAVAEMSEGAEFARFLDDVKTEVEAIDSFPDVVEAPVIRELGRTDPVVSVAVAGPMVASHLKAYAEDLRDRLQQLEGVSQVSIDGFSDHQFRVTVPNYNLRQFGLSVADIANAIDRQSIDLPVGGIEMRDREVLVRFTDLRRSPRELEELIIVGGASGAEIRLGDIASVTDRFELDEDKVVFAGRRAAVLKVSKTKAEDTLNVMDAVSAFVDAERRQAPPDVIFTLTQNVSSIVRDRLQMLMRNGWQGLALVFLTMWLFFPLRFSFWVAMGLPVSFLGGLFLMSMIGYSINMMTMVALLIALGLLMDDAIVIAENVANHVARGKSALQAAVDGTGEVASGVLSSFLTTVAVFGPLAFLEGDIGKVLKVLPVVLILVLAVSLVEAFFILPNHLAHALSHPSTPSPFRRRVERVFEYARDRILGRSIDVALRWRYLIMGMVVAAFVISIGMLAGGQLKFRAFPAIDGDVVEARILLPQGAPLWRTEAVVAHVAAALDRVGIEYAPHQPDGEALVQDVSIQFNSNPDAHETGPHVATVKGDLLTAERRYGRIDDILGRWREETGELADVLSISFTEPQIGPQGLPIEIRVSGPDLAALKAASRDIQEWLSLYRGVFDLSDDLRPGKPELQLTLREGALALGLDAVTIAGQLRAAFFGAPASEVQLGPEAYEIDVRLGEADQDSFADLEDFRITTATGQQVPLSEIVRIRTDRGYARINRIDGRRTVTIQGDVDTRLANVAEITSDTEKRFLPELERRYPSVQVSLRGQTREAATTGGSVIRGFALGLIGIFVVLSFQFRSYLEPLVVMAAIPLALIGVVWGHVLMGLDLSMPSILGFASLAGVVVNDAILLIGSLKRQAIAGNSVTASAGVASQERFRAVLLTSLTTIAGLLPLLAEKSLQAQVLIPLAASIVFGLLASTLLVLLVVPTLYSVVDDIGLSALSSGAATHRNAAPSA